MNEFSGQVALVTGAASGIGLVVAHKLLDEGAQVALLDFIEKGLQQEFESYGDRVLLIGIDITDEARVQEVIGQALVHFGKIDILVNCVGITGITNLKSHEVSSENLHKVFEVNFMSCFYTSKAVLPSMMAQKYGRILHIASIAGKEGNAGMLAYSSSKAAVIGLTKVQGKEYAEYGITVNALSLIHISEPTRR